jgi:hypothetical protein
MKDGATAVQESGEMTRKRRPPSELDMEHLDLSWDGVDQCQNFGLGILKFHIETLRNMAEDIGGSDGGRLHLLVWLMTDQMDRVDSFLERLCEAMKNEDIKLEG